MDVFLTLLSNIAPLYVIIALGWLAGRFYDVQKESLASLAIYIIVPIISFYFMAELEFKPIYAMFPVVVFALFSAITFLFLNIGKRVYPDKRANLLAMCSSATNTGYLGLPIIIMLFPPEWVGVYVFGMIGGLLYEATVFYYVANRGSFTPQKSLMRVLKFPTLYATVLGVGFNFMDFDLPQQLDSFWEYFKGAYVVVGMMIIGVSLSRVAKLVVAPRFLFIVFVAQFVVWPLMAFCTIELDQNLTHWFSPEIHKMLWIIAIVPPAANVAAFAAQLDLNPEKAATTVLIGTIFALFYIPAMLVLGGFY